MPYLNQTSKSQSLARLWVMIVFPSAVIPIAGAMILMHFFDGVSWVNEPFHSLLESIGSFAALILALFIITMRNDKELNPRYIWVATTLMAMGLLDGFHAGVAPGNEFVWLHSLATFIGGVTFALVTLPDRISKLPILNYAPLIMAIFAISIGLISIFLPHLIPSMLSNGQFTVTAEFLNITGGIGFIIATIYFIQKKNVEDQFERHLLANHTLLFGIAGLLFHFSLIWDATWWFWHILRLAAYLIILTFFLKIFLESVKEIKINEKRLKEKTLELERERSITSGIIENTPSLISLTDPQGNYIIVNESFSRFFNITKQGVYQNSDDQLLPPSILDNCKKLDQDVLAQKENIEQEISFKINDSDYTFIVTKFPLKDSHKNTYAVGTILTNITQRKKMENNLQLAQKIIDHTNEGIIVTDADGLITQVNIAYSEITGYSSKELFNRNPSFLKSGTHTPVFYKELWNTLQTTGHWSGEIWDNKKNGESFPQWLSISAIKDSNKKIINYVGLMHDITKEKQIEAELKSIAYYDSLTGIPNRLLFKDRLMQEIAHCDREEKSLAVMILDLDDFKLVNDSLGHDAGDILLSAVALRLKNKTRKIDTVARLGGDEFAIILSQLEELDTATNIAQKIINQIEQPYVINGNTVNISASIGIATYPKDSDKVATLIKYADLALYSAKDAGRNTFAFFSKELQDETNHFIETKQALSQAIENNEFEVYYQPQIELKTNKVIGMEALIRWNHPTKGLIYPDSFIGLSEKTGLILPIGAWILKEACIQTEKWSKQFNTPLEIAVNLSTKQFKDENIIELIKDTLKQSELTLGKLELEITESSLVDNIEGAIQTMNKIQQLGIKLSIDDFGTGFSSLNYLKRFPIHTLKIDRSFIQDLVQDADDRAIIESIILLSQSLKLNVIAEGIEDGEQLAFLNQKNCRYGQGYLFSKPLNTQDFEAYLIQNLT